MPFWLRCQVKFSRNWARTNKAGSLPKVERLLLFWGMLACLLASSLCVSDSFLFARLIYSSHLSRIGGIRELLKCLKWLEALSAQFPFLTYSVAESVDHSVVLLLPVLVRVTSKRETLIRKILIFLDQAPLSFKSLFIIPIKIAVIAYRQS